MSRVFLEIGGPFYSIQWGKIGWHFEMHRYCGPIVVNPRTLDPVDRQPNEKSGFWKAVATWDKQGKRVGPQGRCLYHYDGKSE